MEFHSVTSVNDLLDQFGQVISSDGPTARTENDLLGSMYHDVLAEMVGITAHQWSNDIRRSAVKGFFISGPPGTGKTTLTRRVALELGLRFGDPAETGQEGEVVLALIDGGELARSRYGESEQRIREVFNRAQKGFNKPGQRSVILFDDVESILMARGSGNAKEWHFSQDSVFFHSVDELDTSRTVLFLTSNRPDLVDDAILDRFLGYEFPVPNTDLVVEVAQRRALEQHLDDQQMMHLVDRVRGAAELGRVRSLREVERMVVRQYIEGLLGRKASALIGREPTSTGAGVA